jgi:hypothetical protein
MSKVKFSRNGNFVGNRLNNVLTATIKGVTFEVHEYPMADGVSYKPNILIKSFDGYEADVKVKVEAKAKELGYKLTKQGKGNRNINPFDGQDISCPGELAKRIGELVLVVESFA